MEVIEKFSRNLFLIITTFSILIFICLGAGLYYTNDFFLINFSKGISDEVLNNNITFLISQFELSSKYFFKIILPSVAGVVLIFGWILWLIIKISTKKTFNQFQEDIQGLSSSNTKKKDFVDQKIEKERKRRLFLHSLAVLQRDGRLLDFFDEDLVEYDDEQIGMAVRSIHEDCKKSIKKYVDPKPIIDKEEGEEIVVESGFNLDSIKLVGNVSGEPPFKGVLKHPGWKAGKKEVPKLSEVQDSSIISPAEVEIQ